MPDPTSDNTLIAPRFLFRFAVDVRRCEKLWSPKTGATREAFHLHLTSLGLDHELEAL